jgi:threonine synthase
MSSFSFNDKETLEAISKVYNDHDYILDTHGAVGYLGLKKYLKKNSKEIGVFLETAHPIKFADHIEKEIGISIDMPERIIALTKKEKKYIDINNYKEFKKYILNLNS